MERMKSTKGFTLVELLVVISIIALLLSVLMPALSRARESAKRVICGSNTRNIGTAVIAYAQSNDGKVMKQYVDSSIEDGLPYPWQSVFAFVSSPSDPQHLGLLYSEGYIKDPRVFYCPSQPKASNYSLPYHYADYTEGGKVKWGSKFIRSTDSSGGVHSAVRTSYNYWMAGGDLMSLPARSRKAMAEELISKRCQLANLRSNQPLVFDNCQEWEVLPHKSNSDTPSGITTLFSDGHVSFCHSQYLFSSRCWPKDFTREFNGPGNYIVYFSRIVKELENIQ